MRLFVFALALALCASMVSAVPIVAMVYGAAYHSPDTSVPAEGETVMVVCSGINEVVRSDVTDANGLYHVIFAITDCPERSAVEACIGDNCGQDTVEIQNSFSPTARIDLFNVAPPVPEFTALGLGLALIGGILGVALLRKKF